MCQRQHSFRVQGKLATPSFGELLLARRQDPEDHDALAPASPRDTFQLAVVAEERVVVKRYWQQVGPALFDVALNELAVVTELRAMGTHPNVVRFFDAALIGPNSAIEEDRHVRLVMEFCERGDLFSVLSAQPSTRVDEARALNIIAQVGSGLAFLHAHGVSHGNVSLENVLIDSTGRCKLADFRLSHTNTSSGAAGLHDPVSAQVLGNMDYFTPERTLDATARYDPIAEDVWALGVMLFMLTTGVPLMDRGTGRMLTVEAMRALDCAGALQLWQLDHLLSPGATLLLSKLIAMDPAQRFKSVNEALRDPVLAGRVNRD